MTVKYFEDFDVKPAKMMGGVRVFSVTPGQTIVFRYQKENENFSQKDDEYTLYVTNVDSHTISGWCKERNDFRKFKRDNLTSMIYTTSHFLTDKPKEQTVNKEFPLIAGLSLAENLQIAQMRHPGKNWVIEGSKVVHKDLIRIVKDDNDAVELHVGKRIILILRVSSQTVNGSEANKQNIIQQLQKAINVLQE